MGGERERERERKRERERERGRERMDRVRVPPLLVPPLVLSWAAVGVVVVWPALEEGVVVK
jgi:hypothetical protein